MRQLRAPVDVAHGIKPVQARDAHLVVDLDRTAPLQPDRLQADALAQRAPAHRDQQLRARHALAALELEHHLAALARRPQHLDAEADVDARVA